MAELVEPLVERPFGLTDIHEEIFAVRSYAIEAGFSGDNTEFFFVCAEGYPRGPGEGAPGGGEIFWIADGYRGFGLVGIGRHLY
jgi:hypothetical protein